MIFLLDEQLDSPKEEVARSLDIFGEEFGFNFRSLRNEAPGLKDPEIPAYCKERDIGVLVSANFRDFAAKLPLYEALITNGVSVVVLRPQAKKSLSVRQQSSMMIKHLKSIANKLEVASGSCLLLRLNESECKQRSLEELHEEISGRLRLP